MFLRGAGEYMLGGAIVDILEEVDSWVNQQPSWFACGSYVAYVAEASRPEEITQPALMIPADVVLAKTPDPFEVP